MRATVTSSLVVVVLAGLAACTHEPAHQSSSDPEVAAADTALARRLIERADRFEYEGRYDSALVYFDKARPIYEAAEDWEGFVHCYAQMGNFAIKLARYEEAERYLNEGLVAGRRLMGERDIVIGEAISGLADLAIQKSDYAKGRALLQTALGIMKDNAEADRASFGQLLFQIGEMRRLDGDLDGARKSDLSALQIYGRLHGEYRVKVAEINAAIGLIHKSSGRYDSALVVVNKTIEEVQAVNKEHPALVGMLQTVGETYRLQGQYELAMDAHNEALHIARRSLGENHPATAFILNDMGIVYVVSGDPEKGIKYYYSATNIIKDVFGEDHLELGTQYSNLGVAYRMLGDLDESRDMLHAALRIKRSVLNGPHENIAVTLNNLGKVYMEEGEYDLAEEYLTEALKMFSEVYGKAHPYVANQYNRVGELSRVLGHPNEAIIFHSRALRIFRATSGERDPYVADTYRDLGAAYEALGNIDRAVYYYELARQHRIETDGPQHPEIAESFNDLGEVYRLRGWFDIALVEYENAMRANVTGGLTETTAIPVLDSYAVSEEDLQRSLWGKAQVLVDRPGSVRGKQLDLYEASQVYLAASRSIDRMRRIIQHQGSKLRRAELEALLLADAVETSVRRFQMTGDEHFDSLAFYFAEKGKAGLLLESFSDARARRFAGIPDSLLAKERKILRDLNLAEQKRIQPSRRDHGTQSVEGSDQERETFRLKVRHQEFIDDLEKAYPRYYDLKYNVQVATPADVQGRVLSDDTALLEYVIGEKEIFIFSITPTSLDVTSVPKESLLEHHITELRRGIVEKNFDVYAEHAHALYRQLVEPVREKLKVGSLIVVPDGPLNYVPFEALLTSDVGASGLREYSRLPYLINDYSVSYAYSATLVLETQKRERVEPKKDYLAFAPVFAGGLPVGSRGRELLEANRSERTVGSESYARYVSSARAASHARDVNSDRAERFLGYLPMTRTEVTGILELFKNQYGWFDRLFSRRSEVYLDEEAAETNVKHAALGEYRYLHFATHSFANKTNPDASGIVLYPESGEAEDTTASNFSEDGVLRLSEIYNLRLNADLVVLSACETGIGPVAKGEGIMSLTRGFLYAGASNVLVSLWSAEDVQTSVLMQSFYRVLLSTGRKPESLRAAKLEIIHGNPRYAKPFYWAPFVLVGK